MTGDYPAAAQNLEQAQRIFRDLGEWGGEATGLNETGTLHRVTGDLARAEACHQQALDLARAIASPWDEAHALAGLGRCAIAAGRTAGAEESLQQGHEIFRRIGAAEAIDIADQLDALTSAAGDQHQRAEPDSPDRDHPDSRVPPNGHLADQLVPKGEDGCL